MPMPELQWSEPGFAEIAGIVATRAGLTFGSTRFESAENGIRRAMTRTGLADFARYQQLLVSDSRVFDDLLAELVIGETYFFRDPAQFEFIRREVLPEVRRRRGAEHVLRSWSAGCASGEEAYSLAMLFEAEGWAGRSHVLGTDISPRALAAARRASYREWSFRGDGASQAMRHVTRRSEEYVVSDALRGRVEFRSLNLALEIYPSVATATTSLDLILCRNVLIYFDAATVANVARRLFESLASGGWLVTGASDPPLGEHAPFETVIAPEGVFLRRGVPAVGWTPSSDLVGNEWVARPEPLRRAWESFTPFDDSGCATPIPSLEPATPEITAAVDDVQSRLADVRALANSDASRAEQACADAATRHPLSVELHYLHAVLLLELGQIEAAASAVRRVIYLDRSLALAHFTLGSILRGLGDLDGARRAYRNAKDLCETRPADELVPLSEGEQSGRLKEAAELQLSLLTVL